MEVFESLGSIAFDVVKIAFAVGLIIFVLKKILPPKAIKHLEDNPFVVNIIVLLLSMGLPFLGAWLNAMTFKSKEMVEYAWIGFYSAGINTFGFETAKNILKKIRS